MSHGAGLVRTTCSSGGALGHGARAAQPGTSPLEGLLDPGYPRTHAALLKVAQMVTLMIAFICVRSYLWTDYNAYSYFEVATICNLIMILAFYLVHLFRFYRVLTCISWPLSELLHYLIGTLLLLIASIMASGLVAGAIFGFAATFLCMASMWLSYVSCVIQSTDAASDEATAPRPLRSCAERRTCAPGKASGPVFLCQSPARLVGTRKGLHPLPAFPGSQLPELLSWPETLSPAFRGNIPPFWERKAASREFCFRPFCF
uniref:MARVEL domain-containing protein n=1 Tax=Aotus nancymaae TaxID=37293 RepID=A0A2K5E4S9_AOTNA